MQYLLFIVFLSLFFLYLATSEPTDGDVGGEFQIAALVALTLILGALLTPLPGTAYMDETSRPPAHVQSTSSSQQWIVVRGMY